MSKVELTPVEDLSPGAIDVRPVDRDWSEGYAEDWDFFAAPDCPVCGDYARWISGEDLYAELTSDDDAESDNAPEYASESWEAWRCANPNCEKCGEEIDALEQDLGPMMNYAYPFPDSLDQSDAEKIAHLPLCIVRQEGTGEYELALSGGGMDLSWEICEAFMILGYLPPAHFAELPGMAGRGRSDRDRWIIAGCRRTAQEALQRAQWRAERIGQTLDRIEENAR